MMMLRSLKICTAMVAALAGMLAMGCAQAKPLSRQKAPNVVFILVDDLRFDAMGALDSRLHTPNIDRLVHGGVLYRNAFVTTSLCSPSRATILTGQTARNHHVVGNEDPEPKGLIYFPAYLRRAGYQTAMIGKWHMGHGDQPRAGFDHWVSFAGQGVYVPSEAPGGVQMLNIDGRHVPQKGYITDELTDYAINWLNRTDRRKPFFLYLSHKGVHENFTPAERYRGQYANLPIRLPDSAADTELNNRGKPRWVRTQRNSWHGVDFAYYGDRSLPDEERNYFATLSAVDDSVGRVLDWLEKSGHSKDTVVFFMGDNGFLFGEHGLIDKRNAYEESMRVPLVAYGPGILPAGKVVTEIVANVDIAPTVLDLAGLKPAPQFEGMSFLPLSRGDPPTRPWRDHLIYEYYWEFALPHTPTTFAIRTDRYKYITYHGIWDLDELYDLQTDPHEMHNLTFDKALEPLKARLRSQLYAELRDHDGRRMIPFAARDRDGRIMRDPDGAPPGEFPPQWFSHKDAGARP